MVRKQEGACRLPKEKRVEKKRHMRFWLLGEGRGREGICPFFLADSGRCCNAVDSEVECDASPVHGIHIVNPC